jgi:hypothetical protein
MPRANLLVAVVFVCSLLLPGLAFSSQETAYARQDTGFGSAVPITNPEGATVGSITVTDVVDPFTDYDPNYTPEAGSRYVAVTVAFDADAGQRFDIQPSSIVLQDDQGFIVSQAYISLPSDALIPIVSSQTLSPGSRITGLVAFALPEDRSPAHVFLQPRGNQLILLADLSNTPIPAIGDAVPVHDSEGGSGTVTVEVVTDPFEDLAPDQVAPEGSRFVGATLVFENTSDGRFTIEPYGITLQDATGLLWGSTYAYRPDDAMIVPDITSASLAPGDRLTGEIFFAVPIGADLAGLFISPTYGQYIEIADLAGGVTPSVATEATPVSAVTEPTPSPVAEVEEQSTDSTESSACAGFEQWLSETRDRIQRARTLSDEVATLSDLDVLTEHALAFEQLASDQAASSFPEAAGPVNKALVATFRAFSNAIDQFVASADPAAGTTLGKGDAMTTLDAANTRLTEIEQRLDLVTTGCAVNS